MADSDRAVHSIVEEISRRLPLATVSCSVAHGVAIASWGARDLEPSVFGGDYASVGALQKGIPGPTSELGGDFALVARSAGTLRLARGRFTGRPLYWMRIGSTAVACNRLLPLAWLAGRDARLNVDYVLGILDPVFGLLRAPLPFVDAQRVRTNTIVDIDATGHAQTRSGPLELGPELALSTRDLAGALRHEFEAAVERSCAGVRHVAVLTGGGVDSSNLLAVAVRNARHHGTAGAFPVAVDCGGTGDDRPHLRAVCRHLGVEAIRVAPSEGAAYVTQGQIVDGVALATAPQSTVLAVLARAKTAGAERVLVGDGAEWVLDASPAVFADFLLRHPLQALRCASRFQAIEGARAQAWRGLILGPLLRRVLPAVVLEQRHHRAHRRARVRQADTLAWAGPRYASFLSARRDYSDPRPIHSQRARILDLASSDLPMGVREVYARWEMASGLPIALPYLDDDYVRFVGRIPSAAIFAGARERGLLRESMEDLVPDSVRYRMDKARGGDAFPELFRAMGGHEAMGDLGEMRELERLGILDAKKFRLAFRRFAADPYADPVGWHALWGALTAEAYVHWFNDLKGETLGLSSPQFSATAVS